MPPNEVVEFVDVLPDRRDRSGSRRGALVANELCSERGKEAVGDGITQQSLARLVLVTSPRSVHLIEVLSVRTPRWPEHYRGPRPAALGSCNQFPADEFRVVLYASCPTLPILKVSRFIMRSRPPVAKAFAVSSSGEVARAKKPTVKSKINLLLQQ